ncbi:TonB-dependent receptor [Prolixibacteraceae bacterium Z1-6]|uniref:TonB-dependent receptor n=1 Tax=Draconibacterium aestuarii TaxID=2998507 RepID=A0A9X3FEV1_9BACT|nr:TonB-dependent receptor [Prolixibacteraceae bacterium Z1-6]
MRLTILLLLVGFMQVSAVDSKHNSNKNIGSVATESAINMDQQMVSGVITDKDGELIPGVTVRVKGTTVGTVTDIDGKYAIAVDGADATLIFSFVGMLTQEISVSGQTQINIIMQTDAIGLEEVVVVGYGTMKKRDVTGAVTQVTEERLLDRPAFNVAQAIGGKVAGVKVIERSGAPGSEPMIRVRGTNSINSNNDPLFVVDGVVGVGNALRMLNPNEIETMDVLKDASATAIYGARGSNGVIIITTKRGISGEPTVEYNGYVTRATMNRKFYVLDAEQMMYVTTQAWMNVKKYASSPNWPAQFDYSIDPSAAGHSYAQMPHLFEQGSYSIPLIGDDGQTYRPRFDTNWESEIFKPSNSTNHQLNIRGGNEKAKFGIFMGYGLENGLLLDSKINRYSFKINGDMKLKEWLSVSANLGTNKNKELVNDVSYFSGGIARAAVEAYSILPIQYPNDESIYGNYAGKWSSNADFPAGETPHNPVHITNDTERYTDRTQITGDVTFNFKITQDLSFKTNLAFDASNRKWNEYSGRLIDTRSTAYIESENNFYWQNENYFNYNKTFGDHSVTGMVGLSWSEYTWENVNARNRYFFDDFYAWHNLEVGTDTRPQVRSWDGKNALNSYFARATYSYKNKYLLTATGRYDGSSKFGENSKYGFFPSGSIAWRIIEEDFMQDISSLSNLKLRLSVGKTGNQEIGSYVTQTFVGSTNVALGDAVYPGLYPDSFGNPDLKWETTTQYNAGLDVGLFNSRINGSFEVYYKLTEDMLLDVPLPLSTTTGSVRMNYGEVENKGVEFTINTHNIKSKDLNWFTDVTFAANHNEIKKLGPTGANIYRNYWVGGANTVLSEGESVASFFGLNRLGTYSTEEASLAARYGFVPGDVKYEDVNQDGIISFQDDGKIVGSAFPIFDMNINNNVSYKNFDFNIDIRFSYGAKKENRTNHSSEDRQAMANGKNSILNAWRPDHQDTDIGQVRPGNGGAYYQTYPDTHWIEDCSFIRGEGTTLGYTFSKSLLNKIGLSKLRVYGTAKNFFLLTEYTGYDPEGSDSGNMDSITPGMDFFMYPRPTTYTFGINVIF